MGSVIGWRFRSAVSSSGKRATFVAMRRASSYVSTRAWRASFSVRRK
jgi:hypothetical protein